MARMIVAAAAMLALAGCEPARPAPEFASDQELRAKLFKECLAALPAGPVSTKYNDWDEVVDSCAGAAYRQSLYCYANCPPARKEDS